MGALPNTTPRPSRKAPAKALKPSKKNQYGRDPGSPSERMRVSDYESQDFAPYCPMPMSFLADIPRLTSGNSCTLLIWAIWAKSAGRGAKKGERRPEWTMPIPTEDLAQICRCDDRTIQRELVALEKRGLAEVRRPSKGLVECRLKYREWESLPDYKSDVVEMPVADDPAPDTEATDETKPGNQRVTGKRPVRLAAGATSKPYEVKVGVREYQARVEGPVDCEVSAVIQAGRFVTVVRFPDDWREKVLLEKTTSSDFNNLTSPPRHGRRGDEGKRGRVDHPRAGELIQLFDPLLGKSGAVLLRMDQSSLRASCESVGDCDHDYLVHFVMQRAERGPIRKPQTVSVICKEALASWKASKLLEGTRLSSKPKGTPAERAIQAALEKARKG
jgi:hypothetical protein